jgi:hypothetical protein
VGWEWVHLVRRPLIGLLYQPWMIDEYWALGGMWIGKGNPKILRKRASVSLCPPVIPHDLTRDRTRADEVGSRRLIAWAVARPTLYLTFTVRRIFASPELHSGLHVSVKYKHVSSILKMSSSWPSNKSIVLWNIARIILSLCLFEIWFYSINFPYP